MKIFFTFDYELFFGPQTGTSQRCMIQPSERLMKIAEAHDAKLTFFVDAGYLLKLKSLKNSFPELADDLNAISKQLQEMVRLGHDVQLHVHPHWEECGYDGTRWIMNTNRYRLHSFSENEILRIVTSYCQVLKEYCGVAPSMYRAGGLCVQPFAKISEALKSNHIFMDSSIFHGGVQSSDTHSFDFRSSPDKSEWNFDTDPCVEVSKGAIKELAISSIKIDSFFYWNLYLLMRINPAHYVPLGDGMHLRDRKKTLKSFFNSTIHHPGLDGYFASLLQQGLKQVQKKGLQKYVLLSHPKSMAEYSFQAFEKFLKDGKGEHQFLSLSSF